MTVRLNRELAAPGGLLGCRWREEALYGGHDEAAALRHKCRARVGVFGQEIGLARPGPGDLIEEDQDVDRVPSGVEESGLLRPKFKPNGLVRRREC